MSIYTEKKYYDECSGYIVYSKKAEKIRNDSFKHYPNKNEARKLRKIMASTGLSEEEVRADATYRKLLSDAQKEGTKGKRTKIKRTCQYLIKKACQQTGLAPQHPDTIKALQIILDYRKRHFFSYSFIARTNLTAEAMIKQYAKKIDKIII